MPGFGTSQGGLCPGLVPPDVAFLHRFVTPDVAFLHRFDQECSPHTARNRGLSSPLLARVPEVYSVIPLLFTVLRLSARLYGDLRGVGAPF